MTLPTPRRAALLLAALVAPALAVVPVDVARAAGPCLSEQPTGASFPLGAGSRCDDVTPPATTLTQVQPAPNPHRYVARSSVVLSFGATHADADADPITFECQLDQAAAAPPTWSACTSPVRYDGLADTAAAPYTFRVRAVDADDRAIAADVGGLFQPTPAATDLPDLDPTPATVSFFVDTQAPNTFAFGGPYDDRTPDFPMLVTSSVDVELASNEADATYRCALAGRLVPCGAGTTRFANLPAGDQTLRVAAIDPAGTVDATPAEVSFSVPTNLTRRHARAPAGTDGGGWTRVRAGGHVGRDYLRSTRPGATLVLRARGAHDVRVLAPSGPRLGRIEIRVGGRAWVPLRQVASGARSSGVVFQSYVGRFSGTITLRVAHASASRPAVIDAVLVH